MQGLEDRCFRFNSCELFNGLPAQLVDMWPAWGAKSTVGYNSSSSVLKFLQLSKLSRTGATPNRATISKVWLFNTCVKSLQCFLSQERLGML